LLLTGNVVSGLGTRAALVALPYQVYVQTDSVLLTGLLGAVEIGPMVAMALLAGALADRADRRRLLLLDQAAIAATATALAVLTYAGWTPLGALYALAGLLAAFGAVQNLLRTAILPNLVDPLRLPSAIALNFGLVQVTLVVGPALGGVTIELLDIGAAYGLSAVSCLAMVAAVVAMGPQPPRGADAPVGVGRAIADGLGFVRRRQEIMGTLTVDLMAMTFGMPRALFPALALDVYGTGAAGVGLLHAAVSAGATLAVVTAGWIEHARRLGRIVLAAVAAWGVAIAVAGFVDSLWLAVPLFAVAGAADGVSAICRSTINQTVTPDRIRGRVTSVYMLTVNAGPRLGDVEAGAAAALLGTSAAVVTGGLACVAGVAVLAAVFPALARYDSRDWAEPAAPFAGAPSPSTSG
jgi:MFS family permease